MLTCHRHRWDPLPPNTTSNLVATCACNPSYWRVEARGLWIQGQPGYTRLSQPQPFSIDSLLLRLVALKSFSLCVETGQGPTATGELEKKLVNRKIRLKRDQCGSKTELEIASDVFKKWLWYLKLADLFANWKFLQNKIVFHVLLHLGHFFCLNNESCRKQMERWEPRWYSQQNGAWSSESKDFRKNLTVVKKNIEIGRVESHGT